MIQTDSSVIETGEPCWKQEDACFKTDGRLFQSRQAPASKQTGACLKEAEDTFPGVCFNHHISSNQHFKNREMAPSE